MDTAEAAYNMVSAWKQRRRESQFLDTLLSDQNYPTDQAQMVQNPGQYVDLPSDPAAQGGEQQDPNAKWQGAAKVADGYGSVLQHGYGIPAAQLKTMSLEQKRALIRRMEMNSAMQERAQKFAVGQAQINEYMAQAAEHQQRARERMQAGVDRANAQKMFAQYTSGDPNPFGAREWLESQGFDVDQKDLAPYQTPETRLQAAGSLGLAPNEDFLRMIEQWTGVSQSAQSNKPNFQDIPGTPYMWAQQGKIGEKVPKNPEAPTITTLTDEEGNPAGSAVWNGKAWVLKKENPNGKLMPVIDPATGTPVKGFGMDSTGRVHDFRSQFAKQLGFDPSEGTGASPSGAPTDPGAGIITSLYNRLFGKGGESKQLTKEKAAEFLKQAGGDKQKARKLAKDAGYSL